VRGAALKFKLPAMLGIKILLARASAEIPAVTPYFKISPAETRAGISAAALKLKAFARRLDFSDLTLPRHKNLKLAPFLNLKFMPPTGLEFALPLNFKSVYVFRGLKFTRAFFSPKFLTLASPVPKPFLSAIAP